VIHQVGGRNQANNDNQGKAIVYPEPFRPMQENTPNRTLSLSFEGGHPNVLQCSAGVCHLID
jgi:hypothetical protein